ncbi:MAG: hypothetical protein A2X08_11835 [Bacteroidetes bacterium GWA2_32_17]|nr:MAG: hypothetical protein A2X08_11835 [Bacteroidetes bacterium GWA2_32_17]
MDVPLKPSKYYHIYNHANGFENIFISDENYRFFLVKFNLYISHIADTLAYCLMPNHFHLLIKIKNEEELSGVLSGKNPQGLTEPKPLQNLEGLGVIYNKLISQQFSNLFNSYTKSFNKVYNRRGSLFVPNFKRKEITSQEYLQQVVIYIHNNPVKHGFTTNPTQWKFSSYNDIINNKETFVLKEYVVSLFDNLENFKYLHTKKANLTNDLRLEK